MSGKKFVSLDDKRTTVEIEVSGKTFEISRLTLNAAELVKKYQITASNAAYKSTEFQARLKEMGMGTPSKSIYDDLSKATDEFLAQSEQFEKDIKQKAQDAIEKILVDNGYEYDRDFWREVDATVPDAFIETVLKKDAPEGAKKGAAEK